MPEMDGFQATEQIRQWEAASELTHLAVCPLPIIALTAQAIHGDRQRCLAAGMTEYVTKPVQRDALLKLLGQCIGEIPMDELSAGPESGTGGLPTRQPDHAESLAFMELLERCGGSADTVFRVLKMFQSRAAEKSDELSAAIERGDLEQARGLAHALKGSAANVSAPHVSQVADEIEAAARDGQHETCRELYSRMNDAMDCCQREISRLLEGEV